MLALLCQGTLIWTIQSRSGDPACGGCNSPGFFFEHDVSCEASYPLKHRVTLNQGHAGFLNFQFQPVLPRGNLSAICQVSDKALLHNVGPTYPKARNVAD